MTATLWVLARFFTILTNLLVAVTMTWVAIGRKVSPEVLGGLTLALLLVGVIYMTLLRGLMHLNGAALIADTLFHKVSPVLMALWWLLFAPRAKLAGARRSVGRLPARLFDLCPRARPHGRPLPLSVYRRG